ncbi:MAG: LemA family protein [Proteobacteria bacterium]|nr:LemA family protein [Pseudomonadota bacterium]
MVGFAVLGLLIVLLLCYGVVLYNGLVRTRNEVKLSWSNIDVLLAQRHDELPKLIEVCRRYMQHESETLTRVTQARSAVDSARSAGDVASVSRAEGALRTGLNGLYAVAENYPNLKADALFQSLQARISALETAIADRREVYNDAANAQNVRIETFPDSLVAGFFDFPPVKLLKFAAADTADVDVKAAFGG